MSPRLCCALLCLLPAFVAAQPREPGDGGPWRGGRADALGLEVGGLEKRVARLSLLYDDAPAAERVASLRVLGKPAVQWQLSVGAWSFQDNDGDRRTLATVGLRPTLLWRSGRIFWEAGLGVAWLSDRYEHDGRRFSSRFQFAEHLDVGWQFTPGVSLALRAEHVSNAGLSKPNPGTNTVLLMLRTAL